MADVSDGLRLRHLPATRFDRQGYGHKRNPGHLDLWSATYLPICDVFVTRDKRQRRSLKILNKANPRPTRILSYAQWRESLLVASL